MGGSNPANPKGARRVSRGIRSADWAAKLCPSDNVRPIRTMGAQTSLEHALRAPYCSDLRPLLRRTLFGGMRPLSRFRPALFRSVNQKLIFCRLRMPPTRKTLRRRD